MKNLLLVLACLVFIGITTTSCKKDWTCECSTVTGSDSVNFQLKELRKNDAKTKCDEYGDIWGLCSIKEQN